MTTDLIARLDEVYAYDVYGQPTGGVLHACQDAIDALEAQAAEIETLRVRDIGAHAEIDRLKDKAEACEQNWSNEVLDLTAEIERLTADCKKKDRQIEMLLSYINSAKRHLNFNRPNEALDCLYGAINAPASLAEVFRKMP